MEDGGGDTLAVGQSGLRVSEVAKRFGGLVALEGFSLDAPTGSAVGVIGPNGAGKSTLLKVLAGIHRADDGKISLEGRELQRLPPHRIVREGIALANQVPRPFSRLSVHENLEVAASHGLRGRRSAEHVDQVLDLCALSAKSRSLAGSLQVLDLKRLEVARALATGPRVLLLDEVAAGLTGRELDEAITLIKRVHEAGVTIVLVEHIERVVREIVDQVIVLDWGKTIASGTPAEIAASTRVREVYLGTSRVATPTAAEPRQQSDRDPVLEISALNAGYGGMFALRDVEMTVGDGEIVAVLGANGAGKSTLSLAISGGVPTQGGSIRAFGEEISSWPAHRRARSGIAHCPEGRRIFPELTVLENLRLGAHPGASRDEISARLDHSYELFPKLGDRQRQQAGTMSGGEQQMLAIGRALMANPRIMICDEVSLGLAPLVVDALFDALAEINREGVSIILIEQNVHRCLELAQSAYVFSRGEVTYTGSPEPLLDDAFLEGVYFGAGDAQTVPAAVAADSTKE